MLEEINRAKYLIEEVYYTAPFSQTVFLINEASALVEDEKTSLTERQRQRQVPPKTRKIGEGEVIRYVVAGCISAELNSLTKWMTY